MRFLIWLVGAVGCLFAACAAVSTVEEDRTAALRAAYLRPPGEWPTPTIDAGVEFVELGLVLAPLP